MLVNVFLTVKAQCVVCMVVKKLWDFQSAPLLLPIHSICFYLLPKNNLRENLRNIRVSSRQTPGSLAVVLRRLSNSWDPGGSQQRGRFPGVELPCPAICVTAVAVQTAGHSFEFSVPCWVNQSEHLRQHRHREEKNLEMERDFFDGLRSFFTM